MFHTHGQKSWYYSITASDLRSSVLAAVRLINVTCALVTEIWNGWGYEHILSGSSYARAPPNPLTHEMCLNRHLKFISTSIKTRFFSITKPNQLMPLRLMFNIYSNNKTKRVNILWGNILAPWSISFSSVSYKSHSIWNG
jgi:hypothetical protein